MGRKSGQGFIAVLLRMNSWLLPDPDRTRRFRMSIIKCRFWRGVRLPSGAIFAMAEGIWVAIGLLYDTHLSLLHRLRHLILHCVIQILCLQLTQRVTWRFEMICELLR